MSTMKAVRIHEYGGLDVLRYEDAPCPDAGENEVLIRVAASSVNPFDWKVREGYLAVYIPYTFPLILGLDVSGVIEGVGTGVSNFKIGDEVFTRTNPYGDGAYAEYISINADDVALKPASLDHLHSAAMPQVTLAAWQSLFTAGNLSEGQTVLVHGAAGGVGHMAVQLAKWRGAKVIGTASGQNLDFLNQLGVDVAIDYTTTRFEDTAQEVDLVLDTMGGEVLERSWGVLKPGGSLISLVEPPAQEKAAALGVHAELVGAVANTAALREVAGLVDSGKVTPHVAAVFPLSEIRQAHAMNQANHTRGKIVLQVAD